MDTNRTIISLKCSYMDEVRRIAVDASSTTFLQLIDSLKKAFGIGPQQVDVYYLDEESDKLKITSELEWCEALGYARKSNVVLHLYIEVKAPSLFTSGLGTPLSQSKVKFEVPVQPSPPTAQKTTQTNTSSPFVPFDQKAQFTQHLASNVIPQFFGINSNAELSTSTVTAPVPQSIFTAFGTLLNSVPKEQMNQIVSGLMTNPMVNQLMSQLLISIAAMSPQLMAQQPLPKEPAPASPAPSKPANFTLHDAVCDSCSNRIVGIRYQCSTCDNYDLCSTCEQKEGVHDPTHAFLKIKTNTQKPIAPVVASNSNSALEVIYNSKLVCDLSLPDGSVVAPGSKHMKIWRLENTSTAKWPIGTRLIPVGGDPALAKSEVTVPSVEPHNHADISIEVASPQAPGRYVAYYRLATPDAKQFGVKIWVDITVDDTEQKRKAELEALLERSRIEKELEIKRAEEKVAKEREEALMREKQEEEKRKQAEALRKEEEKRVALEQERLIKQELERQAALKEFERQQAEKKLQEQQEQDKKKQQEEKPVSKFESGLRQIEEMGFTNKEKNIQLMIKNNGDVMKVIQDLLNDV